jgi:hypothetical protein
VNYDILMSKGRKNCLCTGMLFDPAAQASQPEAAPAGQPSHTGPAQAAQGADSGVPGPRRKKRMKDFRTHLKLYERWLRFKKFSLLKGRKEDNPSGGGGGGLGQRKKFFTFFNLF